MDINTDTSDRILRTLWEETIGKRKRAGGSRWHKQQICVASFGVGMEEVLDHLYTNTPDFAGFKNWIVRAGILPANMPEYNEAMLTAADYISWEQNGYIVVKNVVPAAACESARNAIWHYLEADAGEPESWYNAANGKRGMMLRLFQHEALSQIRYAPKIRKVYEELYKTKEIFLVVDKVSFNPPETAKYRFAGSPLHWDVSLKCPIPFELQGFLYLTNTNAEDGAFHCVPGFHNEVDSWLSSLPAGTDPREAALQLLKPIPVTGNAGDLVVWHQALPHCATPNRGRTPRMVQYVAYKPLECPPDRTWV
ncbi:MAG: phytanoyl-CoA dioxygenase family protein [Taibaiella sp.]|nr:phytanoyl-CoA dioxygenase family protein [Taibaiella sp.]